MEGVSVVTAGYAIVALMQEIMTRVSTLVAQRAVAFARNSFAVFRGKKPVKGFIHFRLPQLLRAVTQSQIAE